MTLNLVPIFFRQLWTERWLRFMKHIDFRKRENELAREAYCRMNVKEFENINARQQWANWRTIPRNLTGALPARPVYAIDLCCGVGHSTEVLAHYLPIGSSVLGLEYNSFFVARARSRRYFHGTGAEVRAAFRAQSVLEAFFDDTGAPITEASVDVVNSCGAVGCHFDPSATARLAVEVARVLRPGGVAMIDSGPHGTSRRELVRIFDNLGFTATGESRSCFLDLYTQVRFVRRS